MNDAYIGLFTAVTPGNWRVSFPDLLGCVVWGNTFKEAFFPAREALAETLKNSDRQAPRPRSTVELLIDAQRDSALREELVSAAMHSVEPAAETELAPIDLVAWQDRGRDGSNPNIGT